MLLLTCHTATVQTCDTRCELPTAWGAVHAVTQQRVVDCGHSLCMLTCLVAASGGELHTVSNRLHELWVLQAWGLLQPTDYNRLVSHALSSRPSPFVCLCVPPGPSSLILQAWLANVSLS